MQTKTVVITGATSGIGRVAAEILAGQGVRIVFVARTLEKAAGLMCVLRRINPQADHIAVTADLSSIAEAKRAAAEISAAVPAIDVLVNNAGAMFGKRQVTKDGLEKTFALNHLAYFILTNSLLPKLHSAACARIVSTSSRAHWGMRLDFNDLQGEKRYSPYRAYGKSKLCNILFTRALAERLRGTDITANCFHPGFVDTAFAESSDGLWRGLFRLSKKAFAISPRRGANTMLHLITSPKMNGISGEYFSRCRLAVPSRFARDGTAAQQLWDISCRLSDF